MPLRSNDVHVGKSASTSPAESDDSNRLSSRVRPPSKPVSPESQPVSRRQLEYRNVAKTVSPPSHSPPPYKPKMTIMPLPMPRPNPRPPQKTMGPATPAPTPPPPTPTVLTSTAPSLYGLKFQTVPPPVPQLPFPGVGESSMMSRPGPRGRLLSLAERTIAPPSSREKDPNIQRPKYPRVRFRTSY